MDLNDFSPKTLAAGFPPAAGVRVSAERASATAVRADEV